MSVRIKWNRQELYDIRRDAGVVAELEGMAQDICDRANTEGKGTYAVGSQQGRRDPQGRWRTTVVTADYRAMIDNARHNTLIRVMD